MKAAAWTVHSHIKGSFMPSVIESRRCIDRALHAVVTEACVNGVSTRSVDDLDAALGADSGDHPNRRCLASAWNSRDRGLQRDEIGHRRGRALQGAAPDEAAAVHLVGAGLADIHDEWQATDRRRLSEHITAQLRHPPDSIRHRRTPNRHLTED